MANETGAHYAGALYVNLLSEPTGPTSTYLDLLRITTDTVAESITAEVKHDMTKRIDPALTISPAGKTALNVRRATVIYHNVYLALK